jgi:hypothetical protein
MIRCVEAPRYAWYRRLVTAVTTGGGAIMLLVAALAHDAVSVPLLVIGGGWLAIGLASLIINPRYAREIVIDGNRVRFISPRAQVDIDAVDIIEVGHARLDINRMGILSVRTSTHGNIKAAPRLIGSIDVLVELRTSQTRSLACRREGREIHSRRTRRNPPIRRAGHPRRRRGTGPRLVPPLLQLLCYLSWMSKGRQQPLRQPVGAGARPGLHG